MRGARLLLAEVAALAAGACARQQPAYYVVGPNMGQPVPVVNQQQYARPQYARQAYQPTAASSYGQSGGGGLFSSSPANAQQSYAQQNTVPQPAPRAAAGGRCGLFNSLHSYMPAVLRAASQRAAALRSANLSAADLPATALRQASFGATSICRAARRPVCSGALRLRFSPRQRSANLHARFTRQTARRGVRPGRHHQQLHSRCRRTSTCRRSASCRRACTAPSSSRR
jgi:hypothetical protein